MKLHAFPNAYIDTDELPRPSPWRRLSALVGLAGVLTFGLVVVAMHFLPTGYDPVLRAVSEYAVGAYAFEMQLGFFAGGIGLAFLGLGSFLMTNRRRARIGAALLILSGLALFTVGAFPTDLEGAPATFHGTMHLTLSAILFVASPAGMLMISSTISRRWFSLTLAALIAAALIASAQIPLSMDYSGFAERIFIGVLVAWWLRASLRILRAR